MAQSQIRHITFRWSFGADRPSTEDHAKLVKWLRLYGDEWVFQLENTVDNFHYQGYLYTKEKVRPKTLAKVGQLAGLNGICLQPCADHVAVKDLYVQKNDSRVDGPWKSSLGGYKTPAPEEWWPWQQFVLDQMQTEPDRRTVHWVYDQSGNKGKSWLAEYMSDHLGAVLMTYGKAGDLANNLLKMKDNDLSFFIFDLPRSRPYDMGESDIFAFIEAVKNGRVQSNKYEGGTLRFKPPHMWVFANYLPDKSRLSADRWKMYVIHNKALVETNDHVEEVIKMELDFIRHNDRKRKREEEEKSQVWGAWWEEGRVPPPYLPDEEEQIDEDNRDFIQSTFLEEAENNELD